MPANAMPREVGEGTIGRPVPGGASGKEVSQRCAGAVAVTGPWCAMSVGGPTLPGRASGSGAPVRRSAAAPAPGREGHGPREVPTALSRGAAPAALSWRSQAGSGPTGAYADPAGAEPALAPRLVADAFACGRQLAEGPWHRGEDVALRAPATPTAGAGSGSSPGSPWPRVHAPCRRHVDRGRPGRACACRPRPEGSAPCDRQRPWHRTGQHGDSAVVAGS